MKGNVTNEFGEVEAFPCPLCNEYLPVKDDKKGKPYVMCPDCGVQMFIRYALGIERLKSKTVIKRLDETLR